MESHYFAEIDKKPKPVFLHHKAAPHGALGPSIPVATRFDLQRDRKIFKLMSEISV